MDLDEFKIKINAQEKQNAEVRDYYASLWLSDVEGFYMKYNYNFGYKRPDGKKARQNRSAIIELF